MEPVKLELLVRMLINAKSDKFHWMSLATGIAEVKFRCGSLFFFSQVFFLVEKSCSTTMHALGIKANLSLNQVICLLRRTA